MEQLLGLKKLQEELGKLVGLNTDDKSRDELLKSAILLIYNSSKYRIFQAADILGRGIIRPDDHLEILDEAKEHPLPEIEVWDFHLGDHVKVRLPREDFKCMQRKTLGWNERLNQVHGLVGIVTNVFCKYENSIGVYFPQVYSAVSLYAGVLEKTEAESDASLLCRWKRGDYVRTILSTKALQLLQRGLDEIPQDLVGKKGRVIGVAHPCVMVTFDEKTTKDLKASSLVRCRDTSPISITEVKHARGFKVGEQVQIISNLKKLIENQKDKGGWSSEMTPIRGKMATVINIQEDGTLNIQTKNYRAWRLSPDSVLRPGEEEPSGEDLKMIPGEIVKVVVPRNARAVFAMGGVPAAFLEYLRETAVLANVDDDIDYYIRFNQDQNIQAHDDTYRKATVSEKEKHHRIEKMVAGIKKGSKVHLDIGPPNYVHAVLSEIDADPIVKMALTKSATVIGYINPYILVIEYENGSRFRVKKKLLTVPEKFHIDDSRDTVSLETAKLIKDKIATSVEDIHSRQDAATEEWKVEVVFMYHGNPPCIEFQISSSVATRGDIFKWMEENSGWKVEYLGDGQFLVTGAEAVDLEVKVGIIFEGEKSEFVSDLAHVELKHDTETGGYEEGAEAKCKADPENRIQPPEEQPEVGGIEDFKYLRLYDPLLARNVFFPYVIRGDYRTPIQPIGAGDRRQSSNAMVNHIANVENFHSYQ